MALKVCICGGGNGAHTLSGLAASREGISIRVLTLSGDNAKRWTAAMDKAGGLTVVVKTPGGAQTETKSELEFVTKYPADAITGADVIILTVPSFAHERYLLAVRPYIKDGALLIGLPGQAGFEAQCRDVLGNKADTISILNFEMLPWVCRIKEYGSLVDVTGVKEAIHGALTKGKTDLEDPFSVLQMILGNDLKLKPVKHFLEIPIIHHSSYMHPCIMYCRWANWDGKPVDTAPLFYHGIDQEVADMLMECSEERLLLAKNIMAAAPEIDLSEVMGIREWYRTTESDEIPESQGLLQILTTRSYNGIRHPMICVEGGFVPDFNHRFLTEHIPIGMVAIKELALAARVPTPVHDKLIYWAQEMIGKEYLVDGKLAGKDVAATRCYQRYGVHTLEAILKCNEA